VATPALQFPSQPLTASSVARSNPFTIDRPAHEEIGFFPGALFQ